MNVAYQGVEGSYSFLAAQKIFGRENEFFGTSQFKDIFSKVVDGSSARGVVPLENSLAGSVVENYDLLLKYPVAILGEFHLRVEHCLLGVASGANSTYGGIKELRTVYSHPQALSQCAEFFDRYPTIAREVWSDTARAAKYVAEKRDPTIGAIASKEAGTLYGLKVLAANIEDSEHNFTRFVVIGPISSALKSGNKCSVIFSLPHKPGSLVQVLAEVARHGLNLTKIESRPIPGKPFEYNFYADFEILSGSADLALEAIKPYTLMIKVLGIYSAFS